MQRNYGVDVRGAALVWLAFLGPPAWAETDVATTEDKLEAMQQELQVLQEEVRTAREAQVIAYADASEWRAPASAFHLAGYAAVGYTDAEHETGVFDTANFNPIFHFQYRDRVLWEAELEFEIEEEGETEVNLEYTTIDFFLNDYLTFVGGKFLSPLGQFRQNLHPAWINKLPSAPPGFGHGGAAPLAEVGFQLRGGAPLGTGRVNYALYAGNGPELEAEDGEIHGVLTEGFARDEDSDKVWGGRIGFLPLPRLEIGLSAAIGEAAVTEDGGMEVAGEPSRDYEALGVDFVYSLRGAELRGEYIRQDIGGAPMSVAPEGGDWETWYVQGAYRFARSQWESVLRYTDFDSPIASQQQEQWTLGLNYLVLPNAIVKLAYEFNDNDNDAGAENGEDRWLLQLAYGY